jgi:predicted MFS family arabinose efflux permease
MPAERDWSCLTLVLFLIYQFATTTVLLFGFGNFLGMLVVGGIGGNYLYRLDRRLPCLLAGIMGILGCLPFWLLLNHVSNTTHILAIAVVAISAGVCSGTTGPIVKATLQNVTHPRTRGQAFALMNTFDDFGRGLGPYFVARLIRAMGGERTRAFNLGVLGWIICGCLNMGMFWTVERDQDQVQRRIVEEQSRAEEIRNGDVAERTADV